LDCVGIHQRTWNIWTDHFVHLWTCNNQHYFLFNSKKIYNTMSSMQFAWFLLLLAYYFFNFVGLQHLLARPWGRAEQTFRLHITARPS
jgi:hypothetical protein